MIRAAGAAFSIAVLVACALGSPLAGQELTLLRELPSAVVTCPPSPEVDPSTVTEEDRREATRLLQAATQASIVGDAAGARDLLLRASRRDPTNADAFYQLGRSYEDLGDAEAAIRQYCRYLSVGGTEIDATEVQERMSALWDEEDPEIPEEAARRFRMGVVNFDLDRLDVAEESFGQVVAAAPEFALGHYNLGLTQIVNGENEAAISSLERYLELAPSAEDRDQVETALSVLRNPPREYNAGAAMATSLFVPGLGHFISGRPGAGFAFLAATGGAVAFGWLREDILIECRTPPVAGVCPSNDIVREERERPYLAAGLGVAGALALFAAIDAYRGVSSRNAGLGPAVTVALGESGEGRIGVTDLAVDRRGRVSFLLLRLEF